MTDLLAVVDVHANVNGSPASVRNIHGSPVPVDAPYRCQCPLTDFHACHRQRSARYVGPSMHRATESRCRCPQTVGNVKLHPASECAHAIAIRPCAAADCCCPYLGRACVGRPSRRSVQVEGEPLTTKRSQPLVPSELQSCKGSKRAQGRRAKQHQAKTPTKAPPNRGKGTRLAYAHLARQPRLASALPWGKEKVGTHGERMRLFPSRHPSLIAIKPKHS
jgi:hypothetical protein